METAFSLVHTTWSAKWREHPIILSFVTLAVFWVNIQFRLRPQHGEVFALHAVTIPQKGCVVALQQIGQVYALNCIECYWQCYCMQQISDSIVKNIKMSGLPRQEHLLQTQLEKSYLTWFSVCGKSPTTQDEEFSKRRKIIHIFLCAVGDFQSGRWISPPTDGRQLLGSHLFACHGHLHGGCHQPELHHNGQAYNRLRLLSWKRFEARGSHLLHPLHHRCCLSVLTLGHLSWDSYPLWGGYRVLHITQHQLRCNLPVLLDQA